MDVIIEKKAKNGTRRFLATSLNVKGTWLEARIHGSRLTILPLMGFKLLRNA